jgi:malyl-CoA/(S)-citramalyl-CoA lyase
VRSLLAVPANNARFVAKAAQSPADAVFLDLEDAVVPEAKVEARAAAIAAINATDWGERLVAVRVNDLASPWGERDIAEVAEACPRLDRVILPKCETAADVRAADAMLEAARRAARRDHPIRLYALVESAKGVVNAEEIAAADGCLAGIIFGPGDYALDLGVPPVIPGASPGATGRDPIFEYALARIGNACRAYGLAPIDGPWMDIADTDGLRESCRRAAGLGYEGKMCIHPTQVEIANAAFSPTGEQLAWAREVLEAMAAAGSEGRGAVKTRDGKMIDLVHIKIARKVLARAEVNANRR